MVVFMDFIMGNVMDKMALPLPFYDGQVALDLVESPASFFQPLFLLSATVQERAVSRVVLSSLRVVTLAGRVVRERGGMLTPFARAAHGSRPAAANVSPEAVLAKGWELM